MSLIMSMAAFALAASITPGPVNIVALGSGARFGFRASQRHVAGATLGFVLLLVLMLAGLAVARMVIQNNYYVAERDGSVYIMRGVQGSFAGMPLQEPFQVACLDARNSLTNIGVDDDRAGCKPLRVADLRESERAQVTAGLPGGTLDEAIRQLRELAQSSVLPLCAPATTKRTPTSTPSATSPAPPPPPPPPGA